MLQRSYPQSRSKQDVLFFGISVKNSRASQLLSVEVLPLYSYRYTNILLTGAPSRTFHSSKLLPVEAPPLTRCLQLCHDQGDCLLFAFRRTTKECAITSSAHTETARNSSWDDNNAEWFTMFWLCIQNIL